jgi:hypothetical protein
MYGGYPPPAPPPMYGGYPPMAPGPSAPRTNSAATTGFVCGIVGFVICLIPFGIFVGGIVAVVGIVFGLIGRGRARDIGVGKGMATAGTALGIVGLIIGIVWLFAVGSLLRTVRNNLEIRQGDFTVNAQTCRRNGTKFLDASGTVTNATDFNKVFVIVHVAARDSRGVVVGSNEDFIGSVDARSTQSYFVSIALDDPSVSEPHCDVTVG